MYRGRRGKPLVRTPSCSYTQSLNIFSSLYLSQTNHFQCFSIHQQSDAFQPEEAKEQGDGKRGERGQQEKRQDCTRRGADRRLASTCLPEWGAGPKMTGSRSTGGLGGGLTEVSGGGAKAQMERQEAVESSGRQEDSFVHGVSPLHLLPL